MDAEDQPVMDPEAAMEEQMDGPAEDMDMDAMGQEMEGQMDSPSPGMEDAMDQMEDIEQEEEAHVDFSNDASK